MNTSTETQEAVTVEEVGATTIDVADSETPPETTTETNESSSSPPTLLWSQESLWSWAALSYLSENRPGAFNDEEVKSPTASEALASMNPHGETPVLKDSSGAVVREIIAIFVKLEGEKSLEDLLDVNRLFTLQHEPEKVAKTLEYWNGRRTELTPAVTVSYYLAAALETMTVSVPTELKLWHNDFLELSSCKKWEHLRPAKAVEEAEIGIFAKYLSLWVAGAMILGVLLGLAFPDLAPALDAFSVYQVSIPVAICLWAMVMPMALDIDFTVFRDGQWKHFRDGLIVTFVLNWIIQPLLMYFLAVLFFSVIYGLEESVSDSYIAGAVILGGSPCTAMVFVWSSLAHGDATYTLAQVALNDVVLLILYVPTAIFLLGLSDVALPWGTVFASVIAFLVIPFGIGAAIRHYKLRQGGEEAVQATSNALKPYSAGALVLTVVLIFVFQGSNFVENPWDVVLIAIPLSLQTMIVFALALIGGRIMKLPARFAGPSAFISSSNFFELAVAVVLSVYGLESGAMLVASVGVLTEVPLMLTEVSIVKALKKRGDFFADDATSTEDNVKMSIKAGEKVVV